MRTENSSAVDRKSQLEIRKYGGLTGLEPVTLISIMPASAVEIFPRNQRWTSHVLHLRTVLSKFSEGRATFDLQHASAVLNQYDRRT